MNTSKFDNALQGVYNILEKKGKDLTGDGKVDSADWKQARNNAIKKAKGEKSDDEESSKKKVK